MERNGFKPPSFESASESSDDSKESKDKSKTKKKSTESVASSPPEAKKEVVADRGKSLWEKLVGDDKSKVDKATETQPDGDTVRESPEPSRAETDDASHEDDPTLEQFTPEEEAEVTRRLIAEQITELESGRYEAEEPAEAEAREAAIAMLQELQADAVESETVDDETEVLESPLDSYVEDEVEPPEEQEPVEFDDSEEIPVSGGAQQGTGTGPTSGGGRSGGGSGATPPPPGPTAGPTGTGQTPPPPTRPAAPAFGGPRPGSSASFNSAPTVKSAEYQPDYRQNPNASYLLVGGIVGYLIGRRRGRIKTEKRMKVVQAKLEKQVEAKQQEITQKTEQVKKLSRENYEHHARGLRPVSAAEAAPVFATAAAPETAPVMTRSPFEKAPLAERIPQAPVPRSAEQRTRPASAPERIPAAEPRKAERREAAPATIELEDAEVLRISETIKVGATSLRNVYEAKLVTGAGLRRLVNEHLQGKDIRRGLAREFMAKELSYELDPRFRDDPAPKLAGMTGSGKSSTVPAPPVVELVPSDQALPTAVQLQDIAALPKNQRSSTQKAVSTGLLTVLSLIALGLAAYAVLLGLSR
jgi:hypothetical protein